MLHRLQSNIHFRWCSISLPFKFSELPKFYFTVLALSVMMPNEPLKVGCNTYRPAREPRPSSSTPAFSWNWDEESSNCSSRQHARYNAHTRGHFLRCTNVYIHHVHPLPTPFANESACPCGRVPLVQPCVNTSRYMFSWVHCLPVKAESSGLASFLNFFLRHRVYL